MERKARSRPNLDPEFFRFDLPSHLVELLYFDRMIRTGICLAALLFLFGQCRQPRPSVMETPSPEIQRLSLQNANGMKLSVISLGGKITHLWVPDRAGKLADVVLGYDTAAQYMDGNPYFGATIGRYANRIAKGRFHLNGRDFQVPVNNGVNSLHGGPGGFHQVNWTMRLDAAANRIVLSHTSADGEAGYPGNLQVEVAYQLTEQNELVIDYHATTDAPTVLNLTHHSFFNLAGAGSGDILRHQVQIEADQFLPVDTGLIPTGILQDVKGTPFDFRQPHAIGARINQADEQLHHGRGYDHNWVLKKPQPGAFSLAARVLEPTSGRVMEVSTTEPGLQFYSGNFLDGTDRGKGGNSYGFRSAFCLEAQHFPDAPNQPQFPAVVLHPGETYTQRTVYAFSVVQHERAGEISMHGQKASVADSWPRAQRCQHGSRKSVSHLLDLVTHHVASGTGANITHALGFHPDLDSLLAGVTNCGTSGSYRRLERAQ